MSSWGASLRAQFGNPSGWVGRLVGNVMAWSPSNRKRSRWAVELLEVGPTHRVLEVGYGPGLGISLLHEKASSGVVVGIDRSGVMLEQASHRNRAAIEAGQVVLMEASVESLPSWEQPFDRVLSVNNIFFWEDAEAGLGGLYECLCVGGRIAVVVQPRAPGSTDDTTREYATTLEQQLHNTGFINIRHEFLKIKPTMVVCVLGEKG